MIIPTYKESGKRDSPHSYFKLMPRNWPKQEKETVGSTSRFFQYCYLLEKILLYFEGHSEFFALFKNFYLFNPPFLAEPTTMLCGNVIEKHRSKGT